MGTAGQVLKSAGAGALPAFGIVSDLISVHARKCIFGYRTMVWAILAIGVLSFVVAIGLAPLVGSEFVPETDQGFTQLTLRMPTATSLDRGNAKVLQVEEILAQFRRVRDEIKLVFEAYAAGLREGRRIGVKVES